MLWNEVSNSFHVVGNLLVQWSGSFPSGSRLTTIVNNCVNHLAMRLAWYDIFGDAHTFNLYVYLLTAGDDQAFSVHPDFKDLFKEATISESMKKIGFIYTSETKSTSFSDKLRDISEITFLKRRFVYDRIACRYIAPMDLETILEIPYWVKQGASAIADVETNLRILFEELSLHDGETFNTWKAKIIEGVSSTQVSLPLNMGFRSLRNEVLSRASGSETLVNLEL